MPKGKWFPPQRNYIAQCYQHICLAQCFCIPLFQWLMRGKSSSSFTALSQGTTFVFSKTNYISLIFYFTVFLHNIFKINWSFKFWRSLLKHQQNWKRIAHLVSTEHLLLTVNIFCPFCWASKSGLEHSPKAAPLNCWPKRKGRQFRTDRSKWQINKFYLCYLQ